MASHNRDSTDMSERVVSPVMDCEHDTENETLDGRLSPCESEVSTLAPPSPPLAPLRSSSSVYTTLPEAVIVPEAAGKEFVFWPDEKSALKGCDKIVVEVPSLPEVVIDRESGKEVVLPDETSLRRQSSLFTPLAWSRKARIIVAGLAVLFLVAIGLGIGLGVALNPNNSDEQAQQTLIGGALDPAYYSTKGAFNGTGLAVTYQNFTQSPGNVTKGSLILYFQHWTGDIRWMERAPNGTWSGGDQDHMVSNNATNSTSLSALAYVVDNSSEWHIFFIDADHRLREGIYSNITTNDSSYKDLIKNDPYYANNSGPFKDGPICDLFADTLVADQVGLTACWYDENDPATVGPDVGLYLWYAPNETTFSQLSWRGGTDVYSYEAGWENLDAHTSPGCYSWAPDMTMYFMFVDLYGQVNFYWRDDSPNKLATPTHPINQWTNSSITIPGVGGTANVAYMDIVVAQSEADHMFREYEISWAAENTTFTGSETTIGSDPGVPGSRVATTTIPNDDGGTDILVFFQTEGNDITQLRRSVDGGEWEKTTLPIPTE